MIAPPPPPATVARPVAFYDTECFPNYWLLKFRPRGVLGMPGGQAYGFRLRAGQAFDQATTARIRLLFDAFCAVSFNGNYYDVPMITAALSGYTAEQLKWLNDRIIVEKVKPWELGLPEWKPSDHIDVMEVAPGAGSQKQYAGRIHCPTMRDLPYDPGHYVTEAEIVEVDAYCENDLAVLEALFDALAPQVHQREAVGKKYGLDLRSKSDAQMAEAVLKRRCEQATGQRIFKPNIDWNLQFRYKVPAFISYSMPQLQRALELVRGSIFGIRPPGGMGDGEKGKCISMPHQLEGLEIAIGSSVYKMGVGGLHSQEKKLVAVSDETYQVRMPDVASYYPNLMVNAGAWPPALGEAFVSEYDQIKSERLIAKRTAKEVKLEISKLKAELKKYEPDVH